MTSQSREPNPASAKRKLGQALAQLQTPHGANISAVAELLKLSPAAIRSYYRGERAPSAAALEILLDHLGVEGQQRDDLIELGKVARRRGPRTDWGPSIPDRLKRFFHVEKTADEIIYFNASLVYGLAQTDEYARMILRAGGERTPEQVEQLVQGRMARRQLLMGEQAPRVVMIFTEAVTREMHAGPEVLKGQLLHLANLAKNHGVDVRIVKFQQPSRVPTACPFMLFAAEGLRTLAYLETLSGGYFLEEPDPQVLTYQVAARRLLDAAISVEESITLLATVASEL